jgi:hypothetical protein
MQSSSSNYDDVSANWKTGVQASVYNQPFLTIENAVLFMAKRNRVLSEF